jgi:hypothetical protein
MFPNLQGVKMANCPCCGEKIPPEVVKEILRETLSKAGSVKTEKKTVAQKANMAKLNAGYTTEQRKSAAKKAWERRKAKQENA